MHFPATFIPDENGSYNVVFNDLPGCHASGASFEDALADASRALAAHIEILLEKGAKLPHPTSLDKLEKRNVHEKSNIIHKYIHLDTKNTDAKRTVQRISISIKPFVLDRLDKAAGKLGVSRSAMIALAVNDYCSRQQN